MAGICNPLNELVIYHRGYACVRLIYQRNFEMHTAEYKIECVQSDINFLRKLFKEINQLEKESPDIFAIADDGYKITDFGHYVFSDIYEDKYINIRFL